MEDVLSQAALIVRQGGIIIYPTDTAFGIGCRIDNHHAIDTLFSIRKRPRTQATPVLVSSKDMALDYYRDPGSTVRHFMDTYWPGQLTIIAPCKTELVYSPVRGDGETIGLRIPDHDTPVNIISHVGVPLLGPSANFHGDPTPYRFEDLNPELVALVDYVVPGVCSVKIASTVVDCSVNPYHIVRQGAVTIV